MEGPSEAHTDDGQADTAGADKQNQGSDLVSRSFVENYNIAQINQSGPFTGTNVFTKRFSQ